MKWYDLLYLTKNQLFKSRMVVVYMLAHWQEVSVYETFKQ